MCDLYSITKGQQAICEFMLAMRDTTGNIPPVTGAFPDYAVPIVRAAAEGVRKCAKSAEASVGCGGEP